MPLTFELLRSVDDIRHLHDEWRQFLSTQVERRELHHDPTMVRLQIEGRPKEIEPRIVVLRENGEIRAVAPWYLFRSTFPLSLSVFKIGAIPASFIKVFGGELAYGRGVDKHAVVEASLAALRKEGSLFSFDELLANGPIATFLRSNTHALRFVATRTEKLHQLELQSTYGEYLSAMGTKQRNNMKRVQRMWEGADPDGSPWNVQLRCVQKPNEVREYLQDVDAVYRNSWQAKTKGYAPQASDAQVVFYEAIAAEGWLRSYLFSSRGRPIAFVIGFQYAGTFYHVETGYGLDYAAFKPGIAMNHRLVEDLFKSNKPNILDFGFGDNDYKNAIGNIAHDVVTAYAVPPNHWLAIVMLQKNLNVAYRHGRELLVKKGWDKKVRDFLKRR